MPTRPIKTQIQTPNPVRTQAPVFVSIKALRHWKRNVRVHSKRQLSQIERSLLIGWTYSLIADEEGNVICVAALFGRQKASMAYADPPYNVRVSDVVGRGKRKHREFLSGSGELTSAQFVQFQTFDDLDTSATSRVRCFK